MNLGHYDRDEDTNLALGDVRLSIDRNDELAVSGGLERTYNLPGISGDGPRYEVASSRAGRLLIAGEVSLSIAQVDLSSGAIGNIALNRKESDDPDYFRQQFVTCTNGCLFVYEGGLIRLNAGLEVVWEKEIQRIDWFFDRIEGDSITYTSEHEGTFSYSLIDGEKGSV